MKIISKQNFKNWLEENLDEEFLIENELSDEAFNGYLEELENQYFSSGSEEFELPAYKSKNKQPICFLFKVIVIESESEDYTYIYDFRD